MPTPIADSKDPAAWRTPLTLLILMSIAMPVAFNAWSALINNFVVERAAFTGVEIGVLQSLREVPGFMAFTTVFVLLILKEQTFAVLSLGRAGLGHGAGRLLSHGLWPVLHHRVDVHRLSLLRGGQAVPSAAMAFP